MTARPDYKADIIYLSGYFESQMCKPWPDVPVVAHFTHREIEGSEKARLFDTIARRTQLRVAMAQMYAEYLQRFGPSIHINPPVERDRFTIPPKFNDRIMAGFSGYSYRSGRKGEDLAVELLRKAKSGIEWRASGRGWPVKTVLYRWKDMPAFYQSLDILVVTATIEGGPMPPLECLSCGVSVVIPRGVGVLDTLPEIAGIHRYDRGDIKSLVKAFGKAVKARPDVNREEMRAATEPYTIKNWCEQHKTAVEGLLEENAGLQEDNTRMAKPVKIKAVNQPVEHGTDSKRGIYVVAFGDPARKCAARLIKTAKKHMPEIPICLCASSKIGGEDILIKQPDSDIGGRRAKLKAYELSPAEWESVLYLDADTEVVGNIRFYFELLEDGWEFVICKDPHLMDTMHAFRRHNNTEEMDETQGQIMTLHTLQYNGGVWAFGRSDRIARFFMRWQMEWEKHAQRDQGALIRAMYTEPLRTYVLGNEWNTFEKYTKGIKTAGLYHYPGDARRWTGMIPGRIDSSTAWAAVRRFEKQRGKP